MMPRPRQTATRRASRQRLDWQELMKEAKRRARPVRGFSAPRLNPGAAPTNGSSSVDLDAEAPTPVVQLEARVEQRSPTMDEGRYQKSEPSRDVLMARSGTIYRT